MPYQSKAQMKYLHAKEPEVARKWDQTYYGVIGHLPDKAKPKKAKKKARKG